MAAQADGTVIINTEIDKSGAEAGGKEVKKSLVGLTESLNKSLQAFKDAPSIIKRSFDIIKQSAIDAANPAKVIGSAYLSSFDSVSTGANKAGSKIKNLQDEIDRYTDALYYAERAGLGLGDEEYDKALMGLKRAKQAASDYKNELLKTDNAQKKTEKSNKKLNNGLNSTAKNADRAKMSLLGMLGRSVLFSMVFRAISLVSNAVKEGMQNIARYSDSANQAMSKLMSSLTTLKNSFAVAFTPIIEYVTPAFTRLISKLVEVNNWIAQTMAALAGKDTFVKAVAVQEDYAASLGDTQKAAKEAAKEVKKASFAFDTLIQAQKAGDSETYKGPTPDQMFKTIAVGTEAKALAEDIKSTLANLFEPLKASWDQYGASTTNAAKIMLGSLKQLAKDVGASFMQVWKDEGYGKAITDDLLITFSNFALTVANLAKQFDKAWINANTGTSIMRHLGDLVLLVTGFFREASESIKNWSATLDFSPLLIAFDGVLVSFIPIVSKIGDALLWLLNTVLLPLAKWALEKAIPAAFDFISAALQVLNSVIDALKPLAMWLWKEFLQPVGEWTGTVIIGAIKGVTEKLKDFSDWISRHQGLIENAVIIVGSFFAAWEFVKFANGIKSMISILPGLIDKLGLLFGKLNPVMLVLAAIVAIAVYVARAWKDMTPDEKLASTIIAIAGAMALLVAVIAAQLKDFTALAVAGAVAAIAGFSLVGIAAGANSRASSRYSTPSYSATGYNSLSSIMPRLATGTVVPPKAGEFAAILGDNNKDYEVVSPLETMKQAFKEAIGEMGGLGGGDVNAVMEIDGTKFGQIVYKYNNKENQRVGVRMVTTGG